MKNLANLSICSLAFAWLLISQVFAQSPEAFKYQAMIRDINQNPIASQKVSIRISIREFFPVGNISYQEVHDPITSSSGLVSLNIGEGTVVSGEFEDINWGIFDHFLQVEVDETGGSNYQVVGVSQLLSVPYALYAKEAENVDDADSDPGNEIQTLAIDGNELSISHGGTVSLPTLSAGEGISVENGVINNIKPSLWQQDSNLIFIDSSSVGIGINDATDFPSDASLFVNGNLRVAEDSSLLGVGRIKGSSGISFSSNPNREGDIVIQNSGRVTFAEEVGINQTFSSIDFNIRNQSGNSTVFQVENIDGRDLFEIGRSGNVGINRINNNVTLQVRNRDNAGGQENNIIANFERANGDNVLQIQDDRDVVITGDFSVTGSKNFVLDHPLDPANKTLSHNAVESPALVTFYDGTVRLDAKGQAVVQLPDYFEALNTDFHYQLTCIGGFAQVYIGREITNNQFTIAGGQAGMKISWQVSARRHDPWARDNPYQAEEEKGPEDKGKYFYPEGYGKAHSFEIGASDPKTESLNEEDR